MRTQLNYHWFLFISSAIVPFIELSSCARTRPVGDDASKSFNNPSVNDKIPPGLSIENLQLGETSNVRRGRTTIKPLDVVTTTTPHPPLVDNTDTVLYRLNNKEGRACILILTDAIIQFNFITPLNEAREVDLFVPSRYDALGDCANGDDASFTIKWKNFEWTTYFSKTPGGDHWYIEKMRLEADTDDPHLAHVNRQQKTLHFVSKDQGGMLFPTPVGKSFACDEELSVVLTDGDITAKVLLRKLKMQPFIFKNDFGPEHTCSPGGAKSYRDETAPVAVGSTLAVVSILTVVGYGVYRYMKVKKVQYDTMK